MPDLQKFGFVLTEGNFHNQMNVYVEMVKTFFIHLLGHAE